MTTAEKQPNPLRRYREGGHGGVAVLANAENSRIPRCRRDGRLQKDGAGLTRLHRLMRNYILVRSGATVA